MKILFVTPISPFETYSGGGVRTGLIYDALKKKGDVYISVITLSKKRDEDGVVESNARIRYVKRNKFNVLRIWNFVFLRIFCGFTSFADCIYPSKDVLLTSLGWRNEDFDLVVSRFSWIGTDYALWKIAPLLIDIDDLPVEDFNTLERPALPWLIGLVHAYVITYWQRLSFRRALGSWLPNKSQLEIVRKDGDCVYLPNVVKKIHKDNDKKAKIKRQLLTVGSLDYKANTEGIDWFLDKVWPLALEKFPDLEFVIVGKKLSPKLADKWSKIKNVKLAGFVPCLDEVYAESVAVVSSVFIGGGTAIKVIEALSYGKHVLATPFATRGLSDKEKIDSHLTEFRTASEFVTALERILSLSDSAYNEESADIIAMIENNYSRKFFEKQIDVLFNKYYGVRNVN